MPSPFTGRAFSMDIGTVQTIRKGVLLAGVIGGVALFAVTQSLYPSGGKWHELTEGAGIVMIACCIVGRTWCSLYIGGRKGSEIVATGPYSLCRNPLYSFSILGAAGAGAQLGAVSMGVIWGAITWIVFCYVARQEEKFLLDVHGQEYRDYLDRVPRFLPNPMLWRDVAAITVKPSRLVVTFGDALIFLLAVPLAELFETLQQMHILPVLLKLP